MNRYRTPFCVKYEAEEPEATRIPHALADVKEILNGSSLRTTPEISD